jgi:hypothetical protein
MEEDGRRWKKMEEDGRSPSPARDQPSSLDCEFGGHHPTPQSNFQHLLEVFDQGAMHSVSEKLETLFVVIEDSGPKELTQYTRYEMFEKLLLLVERRKDPLDAQCVLSVLKIVFSVLDRCLQKRHVLMQASYACLEVSHERPYPLSSESFFQLLLRCAFGDVSILQYSPC